MKLWHIIYESIASSNIRIEPVSYSDEAFYDSDGYSLWEQAFAIASNSGIRIASNKELAYVAMDQDNVVGAVWSARYHDDDQDADVYDFDMAIDKNYRNQTNIFLRLMQAALRDYREMRAENPRTYIKVWVVNPRLADVLERRYNFERHDLGHGHSSMEYYGN